MTALTEKERRVSRYRLEKMKWCACCKHHRSMHATTPAVPGACSVGGCSCLGYELHVDGALVGRVRRRPGEPAVKQCACGRAYTQRQWNELGTPKVQVFDGPDENGEPIAPLELRDCACGSTLALEVHQ